MNRQRRRVRALAPVVAVVLCVSVVQTAYAWDSVEAGGILSSSHRKITEAAVNEALADPSIPESIKGPIRDNASVIIENGNNEDTHAQTYGEPADPTDFYMRAMGNNPGNTHLELWWMTALAKYRLWQATGEAGYRDQAYSYLGKILHDIEDMGAPPHAYQYQHGGAILHGYSLAQFETLSTVSSYDTQYYRRPEDYNHPGKNIVDGYGTVANPAWHSDGAQIRWRISRRQTTWAYVGAANMQTPAPTGISLDVSIQDVTARPDNVRFRIEYQVSDPRARVPAGVHVLPGTGGRYHYQETGNMSPRAWRWNRIRLRADGFAPNGTIRVRYIRNENGHTTPTGQLQIFVTGTASLTSELRKPALRHPWEYYDYLRGWTLWATAAPYWRGYGSLTNDSTGHNFDLLWATAPNTERALLSEQWRASQLVTKWALVDAQRLFNDPNYTVETAGGSGYRVVLYEEMNFNNNIFWPGTQDLRSPEYLIAQSIVGEPYVSALGAFKPVASAGVGGPILDGGWSIRRRVGTDQAAVGSRTLRLGEDVRFAGLREHISSVEIRKAKVTLYDQTGYRGNTIVLTGDVRDLGELEWNDRAQSIEISPFYIVRLSANSGRLGDSIEVRGYGFGDAVTLGEVWFGKTHAKTLARSAGRIVCAVPDMGADSSKTSVYVETADRQATAGLEFTYMGQPQ